MTTLTGIDLISPYHPSLALNGGGFPDGFSCHHSNPVRYIVRGASHPVISATVARPRRDRQEHAGYSRQVPEYIQLCDIVSHYEVCDGQGSFQILSIFENKVLENVAKNGRTPYWV